MDYKPIARELIDILAQTVVDYFKENPCEEVDEVAFHFDSLQSSVREGHWHPASDGALTLWTWHAGFFPGKREELITYM